MHEVVTHDRARLQLSYPRMGRGRKLMEGVLSSHLLTPLSLVFLTLSTASCTGPQLPPGVVQSEWSHFSHDSIESLETVVILGLNDFHGAMAPTQLLTADPAPREYEVGGAPMLASHVNALRYQYGQNLLILDAGDHLRGSLDANLQNGKPVSDFYNQLGVNATTLGVQDLKLGETAVAARIRESSFPYVTSNLEYPSTVPHALIEAGRLKVGIVGLIGPKESNEQDSHSQTQELDKLVSVTLKETQTLRKKGAHLIVLLAHLEIQCTGLNPAKQEIQDVWKNNTPQDACEKETRLPQLLRKLPAGTVDAVVSGRSHQLIHHWVEGVPVIQGGGYGRYFNLLYLTYDLSKKKIVPDLARIEGPVPVCRKVFRNQANCQGSTAPPPQGRGELVTPRFHGKLLYPDSETESHVRLAFRENREQKERLVGYAARPILHSRTSESELGNLVADSILRKTKADFALVNPGTLRSPLKLGVITYENLFHALPFDSKISVVKVSGRALKRILAIANSGARGFFSTAGLQLKVIDLPYGAPARDLDKDGEISHWEVNRILDVRDIRNSKQRKGKRIRNGQFYQLATLDFLVRGGDDLSWIMDQVPKDRIQIDALGMTLREVVAEYLQSFESINSLDTPLVDPARPRLVLQRSKKWRSKGWSWN